MASTLETCANTAARPGSPSAGDTLYQIDTKQIITWDGSAWRLYDSDGTAVNDADITDLSPHLWLDPMQTTPFLTASGGTAVTADGKRVGCFADRSGNGFDFVQSTADNQPTLCLEAGAGSIPSLVYSKTDQLDFVGDSDSEISSDQLTMFFVWRLAPEGNHFFVNSSTGSTTRVRLNASGSDLYYQWLPFGASAAGGYSSGVDVSTTAAAPDTFAARHIYCMKTDLAGADRTYVYFNGGADIAGSTTAPEADSLFLEDSNTLKLFSGVNNHYSPHWLFEFLVFESTLSDANVNTVNSYLGNKHGITVTAVS